jgi:hypothetical protein
MTRPAGFLARFTSNRQVHVRAGAAVLPLFFSTYNVVGEPINRRKTSSLTRERPSNIKVVEEHESCLSELRKIVLVEFGKKFGPI